jgi:hypothetical protein
MKMISFSLTLALAASLTLRTTPAFAGPAAAPVAPLAQFCERVGVGLGTLTRPLNDGISANQVMVMARQWLAPAMAQYPGSAQAFWKAIEEIMDLIHLNSLPGFGAPYTEHQARYALENACWKAADTAGPCR